MGFQPEVIEAFRRYTWPGNVRELENMIERAIVTAESNEVTTDDVSMEQLGRVEDLIGYAVREQLSLEDLEKMYIVEILRLTRGHKSRAASILGINRKTLLEKRKKFGIDGSSNEIDEDSPGLDREDKR